MQILKEREVYSFDGSSGIFPLEVLQKAQNELLDWNGLGIGVMEMSHRSKEFLAINDKTNEDVRTLLSVPDNYKILLMQGGATLQYAATPMNLLQTKTSANYIVSGYASERSFNECKKYAEPILVAPLVENYTHLPTQFKVADEGAYTYYTDNETVNGLEFKQCPQVNQTLVADMTSSLGTKTVDVSKHGVIFASAQKNLGPAGITVVIVRDDLIGIQRSYTPNMFNWKTTIDTKSIFNTTPCFAVYMLGMYANYLNMNGGVPVFEDLAQRRSKLIYDTIDGSNGFYKGFVTNHDDRSRLNAVFKIQGDLENTFIEEATSNGLVGLKGHSSVGGIRASMFNGMPVEGVQKLCDFMQEFMVKNQ